MTDDLYAEFWFQINSLTGDIRTRLQLSAALDIGLGRVRFHGDGYEVDEEGELAIILPVFDSPDPYTSNLYDLVAWRPRDGHLATRCGLACCLGSVDPALSYDLPLRIHRTPRTWLGDWTSAVVVDWEGAAPWLLGSRRLVADDFEHGVDIERRLQDLRKRIVPEMPPIAMRG